MGGVAMLALGSMFEFVIVWAVDVKAAGRHRCQFLDAMGWRIMGPAWRQSRAPECAGRMARLEVSALADGLQMREWDQAEVARCGSAASSI
ncbi:hypothetical protein HQS1_24350 [Delftia lacustris]|nr:hypothetical protein HQS1_24350 [Delftia lacustris]